MDIKVVLHIDEENEERLALALNNIKNLLKEVPLKKVSIALLANGPAVKNFMTNMPLERSELITSYFDSNVRVYLCNNSMTKYDINRDEIHEKCTIVKAGILKLIELQQSGYAYVKP
jgi:hypothetical protein